MFVLHEVSRTLDEGESRSQPNTTRRQPEGMSAGRPAAQPGQSVRDHTLCRMYFSSLLAAILLGIFSPSHQKEEQNRTFEVDYETDRFLKDGQPFSYISGEMHYFRVPRLYWKDRLTKMKAAGLDTVCTYVEWSLHEPSPRVYDFSGELDLFEYLRLAQEIGLNVILRPGPYICAERDFGGYPAWLLTMNPKMKFRTSDPTHTFFVSRWFRVLLPKLVPHMYGNGGNIIMVQVENEYGSYGVNDKSYLIWLRDLFLSYIGDSALLFTTDGSSVSMVTRGQIPAVFSTVDFGPTSASIDDMFSSLRKVQPNGPLVNSEFYVGWITYWGREWVRTETSPIVKNIETFIQNNVSFNMYMFHGGTNFGFSAGSGSDDFYIADITSYDYDAPISEAGDLTPKYLAIRDTIMKYRNISTPLPENTEKGNYGIVQLKPICPLFDCPLGVEYPSSAGPVSFEALGQRYGFVSYSTRVQIPSRDPSVLQVTTRDRAVVYLDDKEIGVLQYTVINEMPLPPTYRAGQTLRLLIENMGRRNYQLLTDCSKGLISNATIDGNILKNWKITGYPLNPEDIAKLDNVTAPENSNVTFPAVFQGSFVIEKDSAPLDTFVSLEYWGKGVVFVNEFNLGRYWQIGPQATLFIPATYLRPYPAPNKVTLVELHFAHPNRTVEFLTSPIVKEYDSRD